MLRLSLDVCRHAHITSYIHIHLLAPFSRQGVHSGGSPSLHVHDNLLASASFHLLLLLPSSLPPGPPSLTWPGLPLSIPYSTGLDLNYGDGPDIFPQAWSLTVAVATSSSCLDHQLPRPFVTHERHRQHLLLRRPLRPFCPPRLRCRIQGRNHMLVPRHAIAMARPEHLVGPGCR